MKNGLQVYQSADDGSGFRNAAAAVQVEQIIDRELMAEMQDVRFDPFGDFLHGFALFLHHNGFIYDQTLSERSGEGVDHDDLPVGKFLHQSIGAGKCILAGRAETGGKSDMQNIISFRNLRADLLDETFRIHRVGCR